MALGYTRRQAIFETICTWAAVAAIVIAIASYWIIREVNEKRDFRLNQKITLWVSDFLNTELKNYDESWAHQAIPSKSIICDSWPCVDLNGKDCYDYSVLSPSGGGRGYYRDIFLPPEQIALEIEDIRSIVLIETGDSHIEGRYEGTSAKGYTVMYTVKIIDVKTRKIIYKPQTFSSKPSEEIYVAPGVANPSSVWGGIPQDEIIPYLQSLEWE